MVLRKRILVVEDQYLIAMELDSMLRELGFEVVGPACRLRQAMDILQRDDEIDAAVLDINVAGVLVYPIADVLAERQTPFAFATGYADTILPDRFAGSPFLRKPFTSEQVRALLRGLFLEEQRRSVHCPLGMHRSA
jgi:CheY-like chemotaxis protein